MSTTTDNEYKVYNQLEDAAGGRVELVAQLSTVSSLSRREEYLARLLADPRNDTRSLRTICEKADFTLQDFLKLMRPARFTAGIAEAMDRIARYIPDVAEDVMSRSRPYEDTCPNCGGVGKAPITVTNRKTRKPETTIETCTVCGGKGKITVTPDLERQKVALEISGLLKRGTGINVGVQVNTPAATGPLTTTSAFRSETDRILYPGRQPAAEDIVDAEPAGEEEAE